ncbi:MAG TPA: helix-turn-helix domain-containing protein [Gemmataceae bacterium]|nr:helix-turn-helix domain-containing protein [Gemmataceae bacterium]
MNPTGTRDLILDAVERLIGNLGYSKTTMDDVARAAGVGKRTIYAHFPSKEEVVLCTIDRIVARLVERLREHAARTGPAAARLRAMLVERVLFRFDSVRDYSHGLDELFASLRPAYLARRERYFAAEADVFADVLRAAHRAGELGAPDPPAAAEALLLATNSLLPYALSARELGRRVDVEGRVVRVAELLLFGLCRPRQSRAKPPVKLRR